MKSSQDNEFIIAQFSRYGRMVLRIAYQNTSNMSEAEDITQEVFLKLIREDKIFTDDEHIKAWLIRVTIKIILNLRDFVVMLPLRKKNNDRIIRLRIISIAKKAVLFVFRDFITSYPVFLRPGAPRLDIHHNNKMWGIMG
ncbi:MAG: sigma factor [Anaerocolumna aminovalerica]|uniref:RNA polymerase sigma factor n=1 Tax=Anaerocolumna aminovalerica TaxID=1527 RepID=UPI00280BCDC8|nr:sigma factor [Anaerocolumna aminovalerica]MDU6265559.1 sigma factor [Anaerocolumna aminovalerica]